MNGSKEEALEGFMFKRLIESMMGLRPRQRYLRLVSRLFNK